MDDLYTCNTPAISLGSSLVHILLFADDQALAAGSAHRLQEKLDIVALTFRNLSLDLNIPKTKIVIFQKKINTKTSYKFTWERKEIEILDQFTYLGVAFHRNGHFHKATRFFSAKATAASLEVNQIYRRAKIPPIETHRKLFSSLAKSVLLPYLGACLLPLIFYIYSLVDRNSYLAKNCNQMKIL